MRHTKSMLAKPQIYWTSLIEDWAKLKRRHQLDYKDVGSALFGYIIVTIHA